MQVDLLSLSAAIAPWAVGIMGLSTYLHNRRVSQIEALRVAIREAQAQAAADLKAARDQATQEHAEVRQQVADIASTVSERYVRREDFREAMQPLRNDITRLSDRVERLIERPPPWR